MKMKKNKTTARPKFVNTRKLLRKQKRQQKKAHRQEHYMKKNDERHDSNNKEVYVAGKFVRAPAVVQVMPLHHKTAKVNIFVNK